MKRRASTETQRAPANSLSVTALTKDVQIGDRAKKHKSRQTLLEEADAKAMAAKAEKEARQAEARREKAEAAKAKARAKDNLLKTFTCPLTHALFLDPVQLADGYSYERSAVRAYQRSLSAGQYPGVSPLTKKPLANRNMVPNTALRQAIAHAVEAGHFAGEHPQRVIPIAPPTVVAEGCEPGFKEFDQGLTIGRPAFGAAEIGLRDVFGQNFGSGYNGF